MCECNEKIVKLELEVGKLKEEKRLAEHNALPNFRVIQKYNVATNSYVHFLERKYQKYIYYNTIGYKWTTEYEPLFNTEKESEALARLDTLNSIKMDIINVK